MKTPSITKRFAVVIASKGRPQILGATLESLRRLRGSPEVVVVVPAEADLCDLSAHPQIQTVVGPDGSTFQRNAGIAALNLGELDAVVFFDDDVEVHPDYLTRLAGLLDARPDIVAGSVRALRDGGLTREEARAEVAAWRVAEADHFRTTGKHWVLYGCNMFIRADALKAVKFDENLPSFAFGEDYEISIRLRRLGDVGRFNNAVCVHLKTPAGRVDPRRVSYAMIANNLYFLRKGSVHLSPGKARLRFLYLAFFQVPFVEFFRRCRGVPWRGKLQWWEGCARAWLDILRGRCTPREALRL
jgi:GT2 family glycosyltransferase